VAVTIVEEPIANLSRHASIPISFTVARVLEATVTGSGLAGIELTARDLEVPWVKDYDALPGAGPAWWAERFDVSTWGLLAAREAGDRVGGAVLAWRTPGLYMLEGRTDVAVLWDLRVRPGSRRHGVGASLFRAGEAWARARGCRAMKVETQNVNVDACRFYAAMGCTLGRIDLYAYPELPTEVQLIWHRGL
jgi:GNAT superfamily N-acetyltransferase